MTGVSASDFVFALDLIGIFVFAVDGALVAARNADLDLIGWVVVGVVTAAGGGILRDLLIGAVPPAMFVQWYYLADALAGSLLAFFLAGLPRMLAKPLLILDAVGISLFCVTGAQKALVYGLEPPAAVIMGALTAVGGGTVRDIIVRQVPTVLTPGGAVRHPGPGRCDHRRGGFPVGRVRSPVRPHRSHLLLQHPDARRDAEAQRTPPTPHALNDRARGRFEAPHLAGEGGLEVIMVDGMMQAADRPWMARAPAVAWTLSFDAVTGAIVGARRPDQVDGWIAAGRVRLDEATLSELDAALRSTGAGTGPTHPWS